MGYETELTAEIRRVHDAGGLSDILRVLYAAEANLIKAKREVEAFRQDNPYDKPFHFGDRVTFALDGVKHLIARIHVAKRDGR